MDQNLNAAQAGRQEIRVCDVPRRTRRAALPPIDPAEQAKLRKAEYRLGVKSFGGTYVETLLFLRVGGIDIGYYSIYFDFDGWFVDFTFYDEEKEVRAVYEFFAACDDGKATITEVLERDLRAMGCYIPDLRTELNDLRLTCESNARCGLAACAANCPLQARYRPETKPTP